MGLFIIGAALAGGGWLMVSSMGGGAQETRSLHARPGETSPQDPAPLTVSAPAARDAVPPLARALDAAAGGSQGVVEGADAVERSVDFLQDQARTAEDPSVAPGLPRDGLVSWEGRIVRVTLSAS